MTRKITLMKVLKTIMKVLKMIIPKPKRRKYQKVKDIHPVGRENDQ